MRAVTVVTAAAILLGCAAAAAGPSGAKRGRIVFTGGPSQRSDLFVLDTAGGRIRRLTRTRAAEASPAWSPDGTRIAFVRGAHVHTMNADGTGVRRLTRGSPEERDPAWSPSGARIVLVRAGAAGSRLRIVTTDGRGDRALAPQVADAFGPAWSPDGRRIAFASGDETESDVYVTALHGHVAQLTDTPGADLDPAWSPDGGRIAFASRRAGTFDILVADADGSNPTSVTSDPADDRDPAWSPDGRTIVFTRLGAAGGVYSVRVDGTGLRRLSGGGQPDWRIVPTAQELLPDFDQRAPSGLVVTTIRGRFRLGFVSASDNVGWGAVWIRGSRSSRRVRTMRADQLIRLAGGSVRVERDVGRLRYTWSSSHSHWHLLGFQEYELRRASDFRLVVRDRKSGFCLADHWGLAARRVQGFHGPRYLGNCGGGRPDLLSVSQGTSIGYTDRYPAHFHGQNLDVTRVPAGRYVLVHRSNPLNLLRERRYDNDAASLLIRIAWPSGRRFAPSVRVLATCEAAEHCGHR